MKAISSEQILRAAEQFDLGGIIESCTVYGSGHINSTNLLVVRKPDGKTARYILQVINGDVFPKPEWVVDNIAKITEFLHKKGLNGRRVLNMIPTHEGKLCYWDASGLCFRIYDFIEESVSLDKAETVKDFYQSGFAFGEFQRYLTDFPVEELHETLADFHNTPKRFETFLSVVEQDPCGRAASVQKEIDFMKKREKFCSELYKAHEEGRLPLRVTHNDTKLNNVMLDEKTREALCVIDLDTVMPGFSVNDFGDAIRFGANTAAEDEKDLSKVTLNMELFEAYTKGFLEGCGGILDAEEICLLPEGAKMMTLECGMRFLTDYLQGDTYFKTAYEGHNLDRCRTQFKLVECMEEHWNDMKNCVEKYIQK